MFHLSARHRLDGENSPLQATLAHPHGECSVHTTMLWTQTPIHSTDLHKLWFSIVCNHRRSVLLLLYHVEYGLDQGGPAVMLYSWPSDCASKPNHYSGRISSHFKLLLEGARWSSCNQVRGIPGIYYNTLQQVPGTLDTVSVLGERIGRVPVADD